MEPEGSLPHSKVPVTYPYPEPTRSSACSYIPLPENTTFIIFPSMLGSSKWSLSLRFHHQNPLYSSPLPHTSYMPYPIYSQNIPFNHRLFPYVRILYEDFIGRYLSRHGQELRGGVEHITRFFKHRVTSDNKSYIFF